VRGPCPVRFGTQRASVKPDVADARPMSGKVPTPPAFRKPGRDARCLGITIQCCKIHFDPDCWAGCTVRLWLHHGTSSSQRSLTSLDRELSLLAHLSPAPGTAGRQVADESDGAFAPKPREAMDQGSAREELAELLLDEAGQAVSVAPVGGFPQEGLQMFADDGVEDRVLGVAGLIRAMGMRDALGYPVAAMPSDGYTVSVLRGAPGCRWSAPATSQRPSGCGSSGLWELHVLVASCS